jgi:hypothetical protein
MAASLGDRALAVRLLDADPACVAARTNEDGYARSIRPLVRRAISAPSKPSLAERGGDGGGRRSRPPVSHSHLHRSPWSPRATGRGSSSHRSRGAGQLVRLHRERQVALAMWRASPRGSDCDHEPA